MMMMILSRRTKSEQCIFVIPPKSVHSPTTCYILNPLRSSPFYIANEKKMAVLQQFYPQDIVFTLENIICAYRCKDFKLKSANVLPSFKTTVFLDTIFHLVELILYVTSLTDKDSKQNLDKNHFKLCISCIII